jgi:hypothetical protein
LELNSLYVQITGAVVFQPQAGKCQNDSFLQKIVSLIFCLDPPTLSVNIIDFYVKKVKKFEKLTAAGQLE